MRYYSSTQIESARRERIKRTTLTEKEKKEHIKYFERLEKEFMIPPAGKDVATMDDRQICDRFHEINNFIYSKARVAETLYNWERDDTFKSFTQEEAVDFLLRKISLTQLNSLTELMNPEISDPVNIKKAKHLLKKLCKI
jgi:Uri superfamily endonuclease